MHEEFLIMLCSVMSNYFARILKCPRIKVRFLTNSHFQYCNALESFTPNFQAVLINEDLDIPKVVKWIGECSFTQDDADIIKRFKKMTDMDPNVDLSIMISISEKCWHSP